MILSNDNDIENNNNCNHKNSNNINDDKAPLQLEVRYRFDEPHDAFEVYFFLYFLMKTKHVSDETSSIVSCIMRNKWNYAINSIAKWDVNKNN